MSLEQAGLRAPLGGIGPRGRFPAPWQLSLRLPLHSPQRRGHFDYCPQPNTFALPRKGGGKWSEQQK